MVVVMRRGAVDSEEQGQAVKCQHMMCWQLQEGAAG